MPDIRVDGLTKSYGTQRVLDEVSFTVRDKEFVTLLGPSGCGKTTTLMSIAGLLAPERGFISCGDATFLDTGARVSVAAEHRNLGIAFYRTGMLVESEREFRRVRELRQARNNVSYSVQTFFFRLHVRTDQHKPSIHLGLRFF